MAQLPSKANNTARPRWVRWVMPARAPASVQALRASPAPFSAITQSTSNNTEWTCTMQARRGVQKERSLHPSSAPPSSRHCYQTVFLATTFPYGCIQCVLKTHQVCADGRRLHGHLLVGHRGRLLGHFHLRHRRPCARIVSNNCANVSSLFLERIAIIP